ncbi:F-box domain-containing protein [Cucurbitaria berberidis CBS 394.84]|uniref:F-box domain-containing protein n=1 Tax=Cucurbitaria berberidis CBS 394.84 TaxID=1168544 RepID=A0A9P4GUG4_9PLEO|nr:F-box domain-containing protein [Cucurbitaria berberidis CBS 394.84]KAF1851484.1 F-box domain-containing protein [Cucurbitaria berberidis CBS 394.84]
MKYLPDELVLHIISYLEPAELVNLQHVSRHFLNLSRDNNLWKSLCFSHSAAERRRRRLASASDIDPRLAELIRAADTLSNTFDTSVHDPHAPSADVQQARNREKRRQVLLANWDPSYPEEKVNWYQDFIQRHAEEKISWFQDVGSEGRDEEDEGLRREATGAGILFDQDGMADKLVAPLDDGSISIWDACASSETQGRSIAKSEVGLLPNKGSDLDHDTRLSQSQAIMTETGAVECVSIDSKLKKGFFAVQNVLNEVDLNTLKVVSRTPYPFPITALSEAHHRTPLTVGTNWTIHLHDTRKPPPAPSSVRCELIGGSTDTSFSRLETGDFGGHVSLSQPGALSVLHLPTTREWDGNGDIWVGGRFTSMLNFDRRFFPRLRGTVHSGARLSCMTAIPHPFVPQDLRLGRPYSSPALLREAKSLPGYTLIAAGEYKGKGSLELYGLSSEPTRSINSSDSRTTRNQHAYYQNRQTASSSKLLSVAPHGTRLVFSDGDGNLKWVERDGSTPVRQFNINDLQRPRSTTTTTTGNASSSHSSQHLVNPHSASDAAWDDIVHKILPTVSPSLLSPHSPDAASLGQDNLIVWTGDGKLGMVGFGRDAPFDADVFEDALEEQGDGVRCEKVREREYSAEMRRALELQARELRWLRGYGL